MGRHTTQEENSEHPQRIDDFPDSGALSDRGTHVPRSGAPLSDLHDLHRRVHHGLPGRLPGPQVGPDERVRRSYGRGHRQDHDDRAHDRHGEYRKNSTHRGEFRTPPLRTGISVTDHRGTRVPGHRHSCRGRKEGTLDPRG